MKLTEIFFSTASGRKEEIRVAREMFSRRAPSSDSRAKSDDFRAARARWRDTVGDFFNYFGNSTRRHSRVAFQGCMSHGGRHRPSYDDLFIAVAARLELPVLVMNCDFCLRLLKRFSFLLLCFGALLIAVTNANNVTSIRGFVRLKLTKSGNS